MKLPLIATVTAATLARAGSEPTRRRMVIVGGTSGALVARNRGAQLRLRRRRRDLPRRALPLTGAVRCERPGRHGPGQRPPHSARSHQRRQRAQTCRGSTGPMARRIISVMILLCLVRRGFLPRS